MANECHLFKHAALLFTRHLTHISTRLMDKQNENVYHNNNFLLQIPNTNPKLFVNF